MATGFYPAEPTAPPAAAVLLPRQPAVAPQQKKFDGYPLVQDDKGQRYVVIEHSSDKLIALPYGGPLSLRSVQSVLAVAIAVIVSVGVALLVGGAAALPIGIGLAIAAVVSAIALAVIWTCNKQDPYAQMSLRNAQLSEHLVEYGHYTTPQEKREAFFAEKRSPSVKELYRKRTVLNDYKVLTDEENASLDCDPLLYEESRLMQEKRSIEAGADRERGRADRAAWSSYHRTAAIVNVGAEAAKAAVRVLPDTARPRADAAIEAGAAVGRNYALSQLMDAQQEAQDQREHAVSSGLVFIQYKTRRREIVDKLNNDHLRNFFARHSVGDLQCVAHNLPSLSVCQQVLYRL